MLRFICITVIFFLSSNALRADWRQFRGTDNQGVAEKVNLPKSWTTTENVAWKAPLVGVSASSPIVVGGRAIVTTSSGPKQDRLHVLAFNTKNGKELWRREFRATGRTLCHPMSAVAAPSPASDGQRIFAFYSSNDLACLDLDGNLLWYRALAIDFPLVGNDVGMSSSPLVVGNTVVVQTEAQGDSFAAGIDVATGETRWKKDRKKVANWASPSVLRGASTEQDAVLLQSPSGLTVHEPYSGNVKGRFDEPCAGIASSTASQGVVYLPSGGMTALKFTAADEKPEVLWKENRVSATSCSPVIHDGRLYAINRTILLSVDAETGKTKWQLRLPQGMYWSSPIVADGHLYIISHEGQGHVIKLGDAKGELVSKNDFGEKVLGTPAVSEGAMYVQTEKQLWKISWPPP